MSSLSTEVWYYFFFFVFLIRLASSFRLIHNLPLNSQISRHLPVDLPPRVDSLRSLHSVLHFNSQSRQSVKRAHTHTYPSRPLTSAHTQHNGVPLDSGRGLWLAGSVFHHTRRGIIHTLSYTFTHRRPQECVRVSLLVRISFSVLTSDS